MSRRWVLSLSVLIVGIFAGSYVATVSPLDQAASRAALVSTTACGNASATAGAAILVGGDYVLVAAHVVIGATDTTVTVDGEGQPGVLVRIDPRTDLALMKVPGFSSTLVELADPVPESAVRIVSGGPSGTFDAGLVRLVTIRIEEVRSTVRSSRRGFELDQRVELGDSGAGVFDDDGRLVGLVFGRSTLHDDRSFAVNSEEIERLLTEPDGKYQCNPVNHRVEQALSD
jgi:S1-C subfamily serine protease